MRPFSLLWLTFSGKCLFLQFKSLYSCFKAQFSSSFRKIELMVDVKDDEWWSYCPLLWFKSSNHIFILLNLRYSIFMKLNMWFQDLKLSQFCSRGLMEVNRFFFLSKWFIYIISYGNSYRVNTDNMCHKFLLFCNILQEVSFGSIWDGHKAIQFKEGDNCILVLEFYLVLPFPDN